MTKSAIRKPGVVITGAGVATALADDLSAFQHALFNGEYGVRLLPKDAAYGSIRTSIGAPLFAIPDAQCIADEQKMLLSGLTRLSMYCAEQTVGTSGLLACDMDAGSIGVVLGSGMGNLLDLEPVYRGFFGVQRKRVSPLAIPANMLSAAPSRIAMQFGMHGICQAVSTACASGLTAIVEGYHLIAGGRQHAVLCGGVDLLFSEANINGWEAMRVLSGEKENPRLACRPFDRHRSGIVLGEAGATVMLEREDRARRRGARILCRLLGGYANSDAGDIVKPDLTGQAACIAGALHESGVAPKSIQLVQSHGTATELNDLTESRALAQVFGEHLPAMHLCAIKGQVGHTLGASGALALVAGLGSFTDGFVYPVPNYRKTDIPLALRIHRSGLIDPKINSILVNAFGFGGINACVILSRAND